MANKKPKGKRAKTRHSFKGKKLSVERLLMKFKEGQRVVINPNGRYHYGMPFRRFAGHVGIVEKKVGKASYMVYVPSLKKRQIIGNAHLKLIK